MVTYDYRGTGQSGAPKDNRPVRMRDWMDQDVPDMAQWVAARCPELPRYAIGHSVGVHALALGSGSEGLNGMVSIASHAGVTSKVPALPERFKVWLILSEEGPLVEAARLLLRRPDHARRSKSTPSQTS